MEITIGDNKAVLHDENFASGILHTFEHFKTPDARYPERKLHLFLPRTYDTADVSYPVLYMNDGHTIFFNGGLAGQSWNLAGTLERLYTLGTVNELIVAAIFPVDRNREYTHAPWLGPDCCELEAYAGYLANHVKPFIETHYPVLGNPGDNIIAGASHGGLAAFYIASRFPEHFGCCCAMSPSFWVGLDDTGDFPVVNPCPDKTLSSSFLVETLQDTLLSPVRPRIYMDWGLVRHGGPHNAFIEERATARGREMAVLLQRKFGYRLGMDLMVYRDPEGEHQEASWGARMPRALDFALANHF